MLSLSLSFSLTYIWFWISFLDVRATSCDTYLILTILCVLYATWSPPQKKTHYFRVGLLKITQYSFTEIYDYDLREKSFILYHSSCDTYFDNRWRFPAVLHRIWTKPPLNLGSIVHKNTKVNSQTYRCGKQTSSSQCQTIARVYTGTNAEKTRIKIILTAV